MTKKKSRKKKMGGKQDQGEARSGPERVRSEDSVGEAPRDKSNKSVISRFGQVAICDLNPKP